jgi:DNA repair protein RadD
VQLRPYQKEASGAAISWLKQCVEPCLIEAATGSGKSLIVADIADVLLQMSGGKGVLCIVPSAKLAKQNHAKFLKTTKKPASIYSASAGSKCLRHSVIFATPVSILNSINYVTKKVCAIIIDEAHKTTPTVIEIIEKLRELNPLIRVIGLTATPYRTGEGYIYKIDVDGTPLPEELCSKAYFTKLVYRVTKFDLERMGYLTPARLMPIGAEAYNLSGLPRKQNLTEEQLNAVYLGQGRATALILAEVVHECRDRHSVMIFAATVQHAQEIAASLPTEQTRVIGGAINMGKDARKKVEDDFEKGLYKYLVSVGTMTTGVDFPDVDAIVIMRLTESLNLLEQIIGRGSRLPERGGKKDFLLFDYADNMPTHYGEDVDFYNPQVMAKIKSEEVAQVDALCTSCGNVNKFIARPNPDKLSTDEEGYFVDLAGLRVSTEHGPVPGHFGRRCLHSKIIAGKLERCAHRWTEKKCLACGTGNDIAARYCMSCKAELVDPNKKLITEFRKYKKNPNNVQCDNVLKLSHGPTIANSKPCVIVNVETEYRKFSYWLFPNSDKKWLVAKYDQFIAAHESGIKTITYHKSKKTNFFEVHDYNKPADAVEVLD